MQKPLSVLFVCLGNICRSPTAHGIFEKMVADAGLQQHITVDSCGTGDWHIGHAPDKRSAAKAKDFGYPLDHLRARQIHANDFGLYDYILVMDKQNLKNVRAMCPSNYAGVLDLFLLFSDQKALITEVPDPYYGDVDGFEQVINLVEKASQQLLQQLQYQLGK